MSIPLTDLFDRAIRWGGDTHTRRDIAEGIASGRYQYFGDDVACFVTEIVEFPQARRLHIFLAAGDYEILKTRWLPKLRAFASEHGCGSITTTARHGFLRRLPKIGWRPTHTVFELKLEAEQ
jgi:hypothetical protein